MFEYTLSLGAPFQAGESVIVCGNGTHQYVFLGDLARILKCSAAHLRTTLLMQKVRIITGRNGFNGRKDGILVQEVGKCIQASDMAFIPLEEQQRALSYFDCTILQATCHEGMLEHDRERHRIKRTAPLVPETEDRQEKRQREEQEFDSIDASLERVPPPPPLLPLSSTTTNDIICTAQALGFRMAQPDFEARVEAAVQARAVERAPDIAALKAAHALERRADLERYNRLRMADKEMMESYIQAECDRRALVRDVMGVVE